MGLVARPRRGSPALDERARERLWGTTGPVVISSDESSPELAELVNSFYENGEEERRVVKRRDGEAEKMVVERLVGGGGDVMVERLREVVEMAVGGGGEEEEKVRLRVLWWLRRRGFHAALRRSQPESDRKLKPRHRFLPTNHEHIEVTISNAHHYIVELNLAVHFSIARPTLEYLSILAALPTVFVGRPETLKEVVGLMCSAAKESMRKRGMHLPPWRRREYVLSMWFGEGGRLESSGKGGCGVEFGRGDKRLGVGVVGV